MPLIDIDTDDLTAVMEWPTPEDLQQAEAEWNAQKPRRDALLHEMESSHSPHDRQAARHLREAWRAMEKAWEIGRPAQ